MMSLSHGDRRCNCRRLLPLCHFPAVPLSSLLYPICIMGLIVIPKSQRLNKLLHVKPVAQTLAHSWINLSYHY